MLIFTFSRSPSPLLACRLLLLATLLSLLAGCTPRQLIVGSLAATVIDTPGHTANHISFHFGGEKLLFAGDTLFSLGCGRITTVVAG